MHLDVYIQNMLFCLQQDKLLYLITSFVSVNKETKYLCLSTTSSREKKEANNNKLYINVIPSDQILMESIVNCFSISQ